MHDALGDPPKRFQEPAVSKADAQADTQAAPQAVEEEHPGPVLEDATLSGKAGDECADAENS